VWSEKGDEAWTLKKEAFGPPFFIDGFAKSPYADGQSGFSANADASAPIIASQLYVTAAYHTSTPHSSAFASLASGVFCFTINAKGICESIFIGHGN
jgi:hypothetical protein